MHNLYQWLTAIKIWMAFSMMHVGVTCTYFRFCDNVRQPVCQMLTVCQFCNILAMQQTWPSIFQSSGCQLSHLNNTGGAKGSGGKSYFWKGSNLHLHASLDFPMHKSICNFSGVDTMSGITFWTQEKSRVGNAPWIITYSQIEDSSSSFTYIFFSWWGFILEWSSISC